MTTLYISEYTEAGYMPGLGTLPVGKEPSTVQQTVGNAGASTQSSAFRSDTKLVRLHTDSICSIRFGTNPTATTSTARMAANQTEYFQVLGGDKVAVILNT